MIKNIARSCVICILMLSIVGCGNPLSRRQIMTLDNVVEIIHSYNDDDFDILDQYDYTLLMSNNKIVDVLQNEFDENKILHYGSVYSMGNWRPLKLVYNVNKESFYYINLFNDVSVLPEIPNIKKKKLKNKETLYFLENFDAIMDYVESLPEFDYATLDSYKISGKIFDLMEKSGDYYVLYFKMKKSS